MPRTPAGASARKHLVELLHAGHAHLTFDAAIKGFPIALRGKRPKGSPHSPWEILEHMRIAQWDKSVKAFRSDLKAMIALVSNKKTNLYAPIPHGNGQTVFREALLVADHNAYHLGQFMLLRKMLSA